MFKIIQCPHCKEWFPANQAERLNCARCGKSFEWRPDVADKPPPAELPGKIAEVKPVPRPSRRKAAGARVATPASDPPKQNVSAGHKFIWAIVGCGLVAVTVLIGAIILSVRDPGRAQAAANAAMPADAGRGPPVDAAPPQLGQAHYEKGCSLFENREYDAAEKSFQMAASADFKKSTCFYYIGLARMERRQFLNAINAFQTARESPELADQCDQIIGRCRRIIDGTEQWPIAGGGSNPSPGTASTSDSTAWKSVSLNSPSGGRNNPGRSNQGPGGERRGNSNGEPAGSIANAKPEFKGPRPPIPCVRIRQVYHSQDPAGGGVVTSTTTKAQSGVVIGNHRNGTGTVLTCAHGLDERGPVQLLILQSVVWGQIRALDRERDLAVIDCELPADYPPLRIANESPVVGTEVMIAGYGTGWWDFTYAEEKTRILGKNEDPTREGRKLLHIAAPTRHGDSGGPLVYNRELIGVHILGDDRTGWDVSVEEVNEFLVQKAGWKRRR